MAGGDGNEQKNPLAARAAGLQGRELWNRGLIWIILAILWRRLRILKESLDLGFRPRPN